ncbi:DUF5682 family protein [Butyricimonas muris]|uniref:DUF5682 family protein n=1 Tax=Butyricimonas muris TaxID=3378067 RepID=UPI00396704F1
MIDGIHFLGIRHHGPGSAKNVRAYLEELEPDMILLEGPPEAEALLPGVLREQMQPPVALLAYQPDEPRRAVFYPFAEFSPEWQTMRFAMKREIPLRFFDLPLIYHLALWKEREERAEALETSEEQEETDNTGDTLPLTEETEIKEESAAEEMIHVDPFAALAKAAGYDDPELWWEVNFENRRNNEEIFLAVKEAVTVLREAFPKIDRETSLREAWMRKMIRAVQKEGYKRVAVICGAWHVPGLENMPKQKEDNEILKGLPKVKVECTWIPWTYDRLSYRSGYGAGIVSPGWYDHVWDYPDDDGTRWMSKVASLFRSRGMDISVAHVIETVRLAQVMAALRGLSRPSLEEYNDAVTTVMGFGDPIVLQIIREALVISNRMGNVPDDVPKVPLLVDVEKLLKRLRLPLSTEIKEYNLDLRKPNDLERSIVFHRLNLLGIRLARPIATDGKGTFKESWSVYYEPEQTLAIIEKAVWGNTLAEAVVSYNVHLSKDISSISELVDLLQRVIPADLPDLVEEMTRRLDVLAASVTDVVEMMKAIPGMVTVVRYGSVRNLDYGKVNDMLYAMMARVLAGGVLACANIDEDAASDLMDKFVAVDYAVATANQPELTSMWMELVQKVREARSSHPLLSGYTTRLLRDKNVLGYEETAQTLQYYTSRGNAASETAFWFEGFLKSSGTILLLDEQLWDLVNGWLASLGDETFMELLPILRRTFSEYSVPERRKLGEKAKGTSGVKRVNMQDEAFNAEDARKVIPVVWQLMGIK